MQRYPRFSQIRPRAGTLSNTSSVQRRSLFGFGKKSQQPKSSTAPSEKKPLLLIQDDLFHPFSTSPIPEIRAKADRIKSQSISPLSRKPVAFDCPLSGWPTHHSQQEWQEDAEAHNRYWPRLKQANEDEHDLRSGRPMTELENLPEQQPYEEAVSMANWDVFFYTRGFASVDSDRSRRHLSKLLSYPITIATVLHESSPYNLRNQRLTHEGLRSLIALRQALHPPLGGSKRPSLLTSPLKPLRIIILGARAESSLPPQIWQQLTYLFPDIPFHIYFIGPEVILPPTTPTTPAGDKGKPTSTDYGVPSRTWIVNHTLTLTSIQANYQDIHDSLGPFDPYKDVFFAFSPGFGFPTQSPIQPSESSPDTPLVVTSQSATNWHPALLQILSTKCPLFATGFSPTDVERDVLALDETEDVAGEFEWVLTPGKNEFKSERLEVAEFDYRVIAQTNWGVWGIKGKRYELTDGREAEEDALVATEKQ